mgnify:CR=1 FL=1
MIFKDDKGKELPKKVQKRVGDFIDKLSVINWLNPSSELKKEEVDKQVKFTLECFGINVVNLP